MKETVIFKSDNGFISENKTEGYIKIMKKSARNFDGIMDNHYNETRINYRTGLYQAWSATGYSANFYEQYKGRDNVIEYAMQRLKLN